MNPQALALARKIREKENEQHVLFRQHKDGKPPTRYTRIGYIKEDAMLSDFMVFAKNTYPFLRNKIFHIQNEGSVAGKAGAIKGAQSLAKGLLAGVPDVCCVASPKIMFAEFKLPGETLSEAQQKLHHEWISTGVDIHTIYTFNDWLNFLSKYVKIDSELW